MLTFNTMAVAELRLLCDIFSAIAPAMLPACKTCEPLWLFDTLPHHLFTLDTEDFLIDCMNLSAEYDRFFSDPRIRYRRKKIMESPTLYTIPSSLAMLQNLKELFVAGPFRGQIPSEIGTIILLRCLNVFGIHLGGYVPTEVGKLPSLKELVFERNSLQGPIPTELLKMRCLEYVSLSRNDLEGTIPTGFGTLETLSVFDLLENRLVGRIPTELGRYVTRCYLACNFLKGSIPSELAQKNLNVLVLGENCLQGAIPSEVGKLSYKTFHLTHNLLQGTLPKRIDTRVLSLHGNLLEGTMPQESSKFWGDSSRRHVELYTVTLHDNLLQGSVQTLRLYSDMSCVTFHGNMFSCTLPEMTFKNKSQRRSSVLTLWRSSALIGNDIVGPLPQWVPSVSQDPLLYRNPTKQLLQRIFILVGFLVFFVFLRNILGDSARIVATNVFFFRDDLLLWPQYRGCFSLVQKMSVGALLVMFPAYVVGSRLYACPDFPPSFAHLGSSFRAEFFIIMCFVIHYGFVGMSLKRHFMRLRYIRDGQLAGLGLTGFRVNPLLWCGILGWVAISIFFSVPSTVFVFFRSMPQENIIMEKMGSRLYVFVYRLSPMLGTLFVLGVLPKVSKVYGRLFVLDGTCLALMCRAFSVWLFPVLVIVLSHENCFGRWRLFWSVCQPAADGRLPRRFDCRIHYAGRNIRKPLTTREMCEAPDAWHVVKNRKCGRAVVETLTPLLEQKLLVESVFVNFNQLCGFRLASFMSARGWPSLFRFLERVYSEYFTHEFHRCKCLTWLIIALIWSPFIPVIQPLVVLAFIANSMTWAGNTCIRGASNLLSDANTVDSDIASMILLAYLVGIGSVLTTGIILQTRIRGSLASCFLPLIYLLGWRYAPACCITTQTQQQPSHVEMKDMCSASSG